MIRTSRIKSDIWGESDYQTSPQIGLTGSNRISHLILTTWQPGESDAQSNWVLRLSSKQSGNRAHTLILTIGLDGLILAVLYPRTRYAGELFLFAPPVSPRCPSGILLACMSFWEVLRTHLRTGPDIHLVSVQYPSGSQPVSSLHCRGHQPVQAHLGVNKLCLPI